MEQTQQSTEADIKQGKVNALFSTLNVGDVFTVKYHTGIASFNGPLVVTRRDGDTKAHFVRLGETTSGFIEAKEVSELSITFKKCRCGLPECEKLYQSISSLRVGLASFAKLYAEISF